MEGGGGASRRTQSQTSEVTAGLQIPFQTVRAVNDHLQVGELREGLFTTWMGTSVGTVAGVDP